MFLLCLICFDFGSLFWFIFRSTQSGRPNWVNLDKSKLVQSFIPCLFCLFFYWFKGMFDKYLLGLFCLVLFQEKMGLANMALQKYKK